MDATNYSLFILLILTFSNLGNSRSTAKSKHEHTPISRRGDFVDTSPMLVSQYTGKGVENTKIQVPVDTGGAERDVEPTVISDFISKLPQDDTKEAVAKYLDRLSDGEKRWHTKGYHDVERQLLALANSADNNQQDSSDDKSEEDVAIKEGMLAHNSFRLLHHVQPLQWNESLAEQAQRVAKTIAHDPSSFQGESPGENIAQIWHDFPHAPLKASNIWYSERKDYSFSYPKFTDKIRHFSQMIWKNTSQVGLGVATNPTGKYKIVVALYWPIGNDFHPKELETNIPRPGGGPDVYATLKNDISRPNKPSHVKKAHHKNHHHTHG